MNLNMLKHLLTLALIWSTLISANAQNDEQALVIKSIHDEVLRNGECYDWLYHLSENIGGRLAGSAESEKAVEYTKEELADYADHVELQPCTVPYWTRGAAEVVEVRGMDNGRNIHLEALALGNSVGTGPAGITADVIEVKSLDEVRELGKENVEGKIVFFNRPMDPTLINTFHAYGGAADQRVAGPAVAAEYGAVGVLVRSLTTLTDDVPHTGVTRYKEGVPEIPALAISTMAADKLSNMIQNASPKIYMRSNCRMVDPQKPSHNVVAEIKGSEYPEEIILVGGHMDSWDVAGGAHDDGAGCVHAMEVIRTLRAIGYQPKRTIRCVLFMNEENGLGGALAYAKESNAKGEYHMAALESDSGGFTPRGFSFDASDAAFTPLYQQIVGWEGLLEPFGLHFWKGGGGADISPLKSQNGILIGLRPDTQRYFDFHHTKNDNISAVNERELKLGAAAMTSLVYLLDTFGLEKVQDGE